MCVDFRIVSVAVSVAPIQFYVDQQPLFYLAHHSTLRIYQNTFYSTDHIYIITSTYTALIQKMFETIY